MSVSGVYTGQAMGFLEGYAGQSFAIAQGYISELNSFIVGTIDTTAPVLHVPVPGTLTVDPSLIALIPSVPSDSVYPVLPVTPTTSDHAFPSAPAYTLPDVPTLTDIVLPDFIEQSISPITSTLPILDFDVPALAQLNDGNLTPEDALVQAAKAKLLSNITDGGTMIDPQVEADIWNRDLERNEQALQDAVDKVTSQWAKLGWSVPDGLLAGSLIAINKEYMNKRLDMSREISVTQAKLEQEGMFKSLELSIHLETLLIGNMNDYARRVFETSKATAEFTVEIFKERVNRYNALLAAFKTDVETYKVAIDAELQRAEVYKARLQGTQLLASIDETHIKIYTAQIGAINMLVDVYKTGIQAVSVMYEAEKQKIDAFKAQVEAYTSVVDSITKKYGVQVEGLKAYISAYVASADSQTKLIDVGIRAEIAQLEATLKEWEIQMKLIQENNTLRLEALKTVATTSSNLAAGAMSAIHASVSDSFSAQVQTQYYHNLTPNA